MLGCCAIAQCALAQVPPFGTSDGHAWRRILAFTQPGAKLNRDAPAEFVFNDPDEHVAIWLLNQF